MASSLRPERDTNIKGAFPPSKPLGGRLLLGRGNGRDVDLQAKLVEIAPNMRKDSQRGYG